MRTPQCATNKEKRANYQPPRSEPFTCLSNCVSYQATCILWAGQEKLPRSVGAQYATGDQWRNNSRKNEGMEPKQKEYPAVDVTRVNVDILGTHSLEKSISPSEGLCSFWGGDICGCTCDTICGHLGTGVKSTKSRLGL